MAKKRKRTEQAISWERTRAIFGDARPPVHVWERQFDDFNEELQQLAATSYEQIDRSDLWYYYHDLAYVELQPELFSYLFPVCLMQWHDTLMLDESCSQGDAEFHYGMWQGQVFQKMLTARQQDEVTAFFRDSFLQRVDMEPVMVVPSVDNHPFGWIGRFNSLGFIVPNIEEIWDAWWNVETHGRAVAVLKYCSGLVYSEGEHKNFGVEWKVRWYGPELWKNDSKIHDESWLESNVRFIRDVLKFDYVQAKVRQAATRLEDQSEHASAWQLEVDLISNRELVESRIAELPWLLSGERINGDWCWSI